MATRQRSRLLLIALYMAFFSTQLALAGTFDDFRGQDTPDFQKLADAIYKAEGGQKAKKPFGILSVPCDGYEDCRKVCLNTVRNNWKRWQNKTHGADKHEDYFSFLSSRYAPIGAENDKNNLNRNWLKNVLHFYNK